MIIKGKVGGSRISLGSDLRNVCASAFDLHKTASLKGMRIEYYVSVFLVYRRRYFLMRTAYYRCTYFLYVSVV